MKKWHAAEVGPYADSSRGIYIGERIQSIAADKGWDGGMADADDEFYHAATDEAEDWLNENIADDEHVFGTNEGGDWGYWPIEGDE